MADFMNSIIDNYSVLQELWEAALEGVCDTEILARVRGVAAHMKTFEFFWGLVLGGVFFRHSDNFSRSLQKRKTFQQVKGR